VARVGPEAIEAGVQAGDRIRLDFLVGWSPRCTGWEASSGDRIQKTEDRRLSREPQTTKALRARTKNTKNLNPDEPGTELGTWNSEPGTATYLTNCCPYYLDSHHRLFPIQLGSMRFS
jgi:hypothetical protein